MLYLQEMKSKIEIYSCTRSCTHKKNYNKYVHVCP